MKFPSRLRGFKPGKTWIVLGTSIGIGLLAALGARSYLTTRVAELEAKARGRNVNVIVASTELRQGMKISTENVAVRSMPHEFVHTSAVGPDQFERIDGQVLAFGVKGGEPVLWSMLEPKKPPTFSTRVEAGRRAITVPVDEINSISGLLEPGDLIDLMLTVDQRGKKVTVPLIQGVLVMATGQRSVSDPKTGESKTYNTVTLDTNPSQAQNIIVARDAGRITALLRNPQDKAAGQGSQSDLAALLGAASLAGSSREVPVLYGGRSARLPAEGLTLGHNASAPATATGPAIATTPVPAPPSAPAQAAASALLSQSSQASQ
jgi:pilus assembly protein CpaB